MKVGCIKTVVHIAVSNSTPFDICGDKMRTKADLQLVKQKSLLTRPEILLIPTPQRFTDETK